MDFLKNFQAFVYRQRRRVYKSQTSSEGMESIPLRIWKIENVEFKEDTMKFYFCEHCGNVMIKLNDAKPVPVCCGEPMKELTANTVDAAKEKHVPEVKRNGKDIEVQVGSVLHPMEEDHYIEFILCVQGKKCQCKLLQPGDEPKACFTLCCDQEPVQVYEFCNKHGLWKAEA